MFLRNLFLVILYCFSIAVFAQISEDIPPISASNDKVADQVNRMLTVSLPFVDEQALRTEDAEEDGIKDIPWRFGFPINIGFDLKKNGLMMELADGGTVWLLRLHSSDAISLNFNFEKFQIPTGAHMHIYSPNHSEMLGAFTHLNNREDSIFATTIIKSDEVILEYYEPENPEFEGIIKTGSIVHGYRDLQKKAEIFGASGACNFDVNCPEGSGWQDDKRSVAMMLLANNSRVCSGALVNNTLEDGTPYFLTANHCKVRADNVFIFNYEVATCRSGSEPSLTDAIMGCTLLSSSSSFYSSDFNLVRLSSAPPASYNVYYAGWSRLDEPANFSAGIHHPRGDVKKIALDFDKTVSTGYYIDGDDHWGVEKWDKGTTEDASSGSPLFNEQHRIIGQLHGGEASCFNDSVDFYGKFSTSWEAGPDSSEQLKYWLDPGFSGIEVLDGYDPNSTTLLTDAQLVALGVNNDIVCFDSLFPRIMFRNGGSNTLTSANIEYWLDGSLVNIISWTGSLVKGDLEPIQLPGIPIVTGNHELKAIISSPNGTTDQRPNNDELRQTFFSVEEATNIQLTLKTDDFGNETQWKLLNAAGSVFDSYSNYPSVNGGGTYLHQFCLYDGCFKYIIFDSFGDGLCCGSGQGSFFLEDVLGGDTIVFNDSFSTYADTTEFCVGDSCTILIDVKITPVSLNGVDDGAIKIIPIAGNPPFQYSWSNGSSTGDISNLIEGTYTLTIIDSLGCSASFDIEVGKATGIKTVDQSGLINIYPNPANDLIHVKLSGEINADRVTLRDLNGRTVLSQTLNAVDTKIYLKNLNAGIYILSVENSAGYPIVREKVIKID